MQLNLQEIINTPGASKRFSFEPDFSGLEFTSVQAFSAPVSMVGTVRNTAGLLTLSAVLETTLQCQCDRCGATFLKEVHIPAELTLAADPEDEENPDLWPLESDCLNLDEIALNVFVLNLDTRFLCREDCKGLCPRCGKNLNEGPCSCGKEVDPRLAVLEQLLKDNQEE